MYGSKDIMKLQVTFQYKYWLSDIVKPLPSNQIVNAETLDNYVNKFDSFQTKAANFTLGDTENIVTGKIADYEANWFSDNIPGFART